MTSRSMSQSTPSPSRGGIKGGGREPRYPGFPHSLLASPVKGEVPFGGCGGTVQYVPH
jgi:hypothetical protein